MPGVVRTSYTYERETFRLIQLLTTRSTDNAKLRDSRPMASQGRAGHPRNAVWFCTGHLALARQHQDTDAGAALRAIDTVIGRKAPPRARW